jgi:hypothetical protein
VSQLSRIKDQVAFDVAGALFKVGEERAATKCDAIMARTVRFAQPLWAPNIRLLENAAAA